MKWTVWVSAAAWLKRMNVVCVMEQEQKLNAGTENGFVIQWIAVMNLSLQMWTMQQRFNQYSMRIVPIIVIQMVVLTKGDLI